MICSTRKYRPFARPNSEGDLFFDLAKWANVIAGKVAAAIRIITSWATEERVVEAFIRDVEQL